MALSMKSCRVAPRQMAKASRKAVVVKADAAFLGSAPNLIMVASTTACLVASRSGLAPSVKYEATAALKLVERDVDLITNDPAGMTVVDVLAMGSAGHFIGAGIILGLQGTGYLPL